MIRDCETSSLFANSPEIHDVEFALQDAVAAIIETRPQPAIGPTVTNVGIAVTEQHQPKKVGMEMTASGHPQYCARARSE